MPVYTDVYTHVYTNICRYYNRYILRHIYKQFYEHVYTYVCTCLHKCLHSFLCTYLQRYLNTFLYICLHILHTYLHGAFFIIPCPSQNLEDSWLCFVLWNLRRKKVIKKHWNGGTTKFTLSFKLFCLPVRYMCTILFYILPKSWSYFVHSTASFSPRLATSQLSINSYIFSRYRLTGT